MKLNVSLAMPSALLSMSVGVGSLPVAVSLASSVTAATAAATARGVVGAVDDYGQDIGSRAAVPVADCVGKDVPERFALPEPLHGVHGVVERIGIGAVRPQGQASVQPGFRPFWPRTRACHGCRDPWAWTGRR